MTRPGNYGYYRALPPAGADRKGSTIFRISTLAIKLPLLLAGIMSAGPPALSACPQFRGVAVCEEHGHLVFESLSPGYQLPDTLCAEVSTGNLLWNGGPIRRLVQLPDGVAALSAFAAVRYLKGQRADIDFWNSPLAEDNPLSLPQEWGPAEDGTAIGDTQPFPERYHRLEDGTIVFLVDAENPPKSRGPWYDLHLRLSSTTEWLAARNLKPRTWVVNADTTGWALAAVQWVPDFGGQEKEVILAGAGERSERFDTSWKTALWDGSRRLWGLTQTGELTCVEVAAGAWAVRSVPASGHSCGRGPGELETKWTWMLPRVFNTYQDAEEYGYTLPAIENTPRWIKTVADGYQVCLGSTDREQDLLEAVRQPPVPGAEIQKATLWDSDYTGVPVHFASPALGGELSLRYIQTGLCRTSELWWRFNGSGDWLKMAGPWNN